MSSLLLNHVDRVRGEGREGRRLNELPGLPLPARGPFPRIIASYHLILTSVLSSGHYGYVYFIVDETEVQEVSPASDHAARSLRLQRLDLFHRPGPIHADHLWGPGQRTNGGLWPLAHGPAPLFSHCLQLHPAPEGPCSPACGHPSRPV